MDLGIIGNCQYIALIDASGEVSWLCWPRFDSSFVFGSLLDKKKGGGFKIAPSSEERGKQEYIVNTNVLKTTFETPQGSFELIDFAPRFRSDHRYHKPNILIRIVRPLKGKPRITASIKAVYEYGLTPYHATINSDKVRFEGGGQPLTLSTNASLTFVCDNTPFVVDKTYYFVLSYGESVDAEVSYFCENYLEKTVNYWQTWVKHCHLPRDYQKEVIRSALVLKLHQYEDTGAIIASCTTSIPEAHRSGRTWDYRYCWLRDAWFSLSALQRLTQFEEMEKFVAYLCNVMEMADERGGRLQPVYGIGGENKLTEIILTHLEGYRENQPVRIGNQASEHIQHDVYGEMILAITPLFLDRRFVKHNEQLPSSLLSRLLISIEKYVDAKDAGLWEFRGNNQLHTFSLLMHWAGAANALEIGIRCNYEDLIQKARKLAFYSEDLIHRQCWDDSQKAYMQASGNGHLDAALLMLVNLGFLKPDDPRALSHVNAIATGLEAKHGLIHRYKALDDFGETKNAFLICSFWLAEAYGHLGMQRGKELFERLLTYANSLGLYSEDLDPNDFSLWGNFPQTYSHVGLINAAFTLSRPQIPVIWP